MGATASVARTKVHTLAHTLGVSKRVESKNNAKDSLIHKAAVSIVKSKTPTKVSKTGTQPRTDQQGLIGSLAVNTTRGPAARGSNGGVRYRSVLSGMSKAATQQQLNKEHQVRGSV